MNHAQRQYDPNPDYVVGSDPRLTAYLARLRESVRSQYTPQELARMDERAERTRLDTERKVIKDEIKRLAAEADWQLCGGRWGSTNVELKRRFGPRAELSLDALTECLEWCKQQYGHLVPAPRVPGDE